MDSTLQAYVEGPTCSVKEAADILGVSSGTVRNMVRLGVLIGWKPNKMGRKMRLYKRQVESVAAEQQSQAIKYARRVSEQMELAL